MGQRQSLYIPARVSPADLERLHTAALILRLHVSAETLVAGPLRQLRAARELATDNAVCLDMSGRESRLGLAMCSVAAPHKGRGL
jgi:hypothetical protein